MAGDLQGRLCNVKLINFPIDSRTLNRINACTFSYFFLKAAFQIFVGFLDSHLRSQRKRYNIKGYELTVLALILYPVIANN